MNKKLQITVLIVTAIALFLFLRGLEKDNSRLPGAPSANTAQEKQPTASADRIEVLHFHATQQCWSCSTVGEYTLETIKERFPEEFESGKIVFKDVDRDLKENQEIVSKYRAAGSSLFINSIVGEKDNISEDTVVWRLVNNEEQFKTYFENKLNGLLGK